jgi:hypothetical protein
MVRAETRMDDGRLRRMATVDDKGVQVRERAQERARYELGARQPLLTVANVVVQQSVNTPLGSWQVGDEIRVQGELDWMPLDLWFRVASITITPDKPEILTMALIRSDLLP